MKNFKIIICILLLCSFLTGCVHHDNLKDLIIVEGMAIESTDDAIKLTVQSLNVGMSSGVEKPEGNMTVNSSSEGTTIIDAVSNMGKFMSKKMFFGNNKLIVFSREVCEGDFEKKIDYFLRSVDSRADVSVCMTDGDATEILESKENDTHVPVENIVNLITTGEKTGHSIFLVTEDLLNYYSDKTTDVCLPVLKINEKSKNAELSGIGVFTDESLAYILNDEETLGFLLISGKIDECIIEFDNKDFGKVGVEIMDPKAKKKVKMVDGKVQFNVEITGKLLINEVERGTIRALREENLNEIVTQADRELSRLCKKAFTACQEHNSDCLRVGEYLAKDCPEAYKLLSDDWNKNFKAVDFGVDVNLKLKKISDNTQLD